MTQIGRMIAGGLACATMLGPAGMLSCSSKSDNGRIRASGTIEATEVVVASKVAGQIRELRFDEGTQVKTGDILAVLDHDSADLQLKQAQAGLELAESQLRLLLNGAREEDIRQAEEVLAQAEADLRPAEDDFARMSALLAKASVTRKQVEDAQARLTVAHAQAAAAGEALKKLRSWARPEDLQGARARVAQARAAVEIWNKAVFDATVTAPLSGTVTRKPVEVGELAGVSTPLATIVNRDRVHVMLYLNEVDIGRVRLGGEADLAVDASPDRVFKGAITYVSPEAEFTPLVAVTVWVPPDAGAV